MPFISATKHYDVNLRVPESHRWVDIIQHEKAAARAVYNSALRELEKHMWPITREAFWVGYKLVGGLYVDEIESMADALNVDVANLGTMQCLYELHHVGCTSGAVHIPGTGIVHIRNMDWPLRNIGKATRIFRFHDGERNFSAVGVLGMVGVLSGILPGAYSATLNFAPDDTLPAPTQIGATFLLRDCLESCDTFASAVRYLKNESTSTSVFYHVCGTQLGESVVIERTANSAAVRQIQGDFIVQANHFVTRKFEKFNTDDELLEDSTERFKAMEEALAGSQHKSIGELASVLDKAPICNDNTYQQMVFCPATGEIRVWRWEEAKKPRN